MIFASNIQTNKQNKVKEFFTMLGVACHNTCAIWGELAISKYIFSSFINSDALSLILSGVVTLGLELLVYNVTTKNSKQY